MPDYTPDASRNPRAGDEWECGWWLREIIVANGEGRAVTYLGRYGEQHSCSYGTWTQWTRNATLLKRGGDA